MRCQALLLILSGIVTGCSAQDTTVNVNMFASFLHQYESLANPTARREALDAFWRDTRQRGTPLVDSATCTAVFLYKGPADSVKLTGDMTGWRNHLPLRRLEGTDLFHITQQYHHTARLDYKFILNKDEYVLDPLNPRTVTGGFGPNSELAMPGFRRAEELVISPERPKGATLEEMHPSSILGYSHRIRIHLPAGYGKSNDRYPVAYVQDGSDYISLGAATIILDNMAGMSTPPVIGVFVDPPTLPHRNRTTEYAMNDDYVKYLATELVPYIDGKYRTLARPDQRLVVGASYGGLIALYAAFAHPEVFGNAASQSGYVSFASDSLGRTFRRTGKKPIRLYFDVGLYERALTNDPEGDFVEAHRRFRIELDKLHYAFEYREFYDGHSWGRWRNELPYILVSFFGWK